VSSKPQRTARSKETETTSTSPAISEAEVGNLTRDEEIRRRAYEIYLERGEQPDRALDDWLEARTRTRPRLFWREQAG
jgi:Protein of unknown function (DUF2934)